MSNLKWTALGARQLCTIYDPANPGTKVSPQNNYTSDIITPSNVRNFIKTMNGTVVITGDREYPLVFKLEWPQIDIADVNALKLYTAITPVVFVDHNDNGYLGVFVIDERSQIPGKTSNVWDLKASFLVQSPYNGLHTTLNQVSPPVLTATNLGGSVGFIPQTTTLYFWTTVFTPSGESLVSTVTTYTSPTDGNNQHAVTLSYTPPAGTAWSKVRIYWNSTNNPATATMLTEIANGFTASFPVFGKYVTYSLQNPPTYGTAFSGYWAGGDWVQV